MINRMEAVPALGDYGLSGGVINSFPSDLTMMYEMVVQ